MGKPRFAYLLGGGHLGRFHLLLALVNIAAVDVHVQVFARAPVSSIRSHLVPLSPSHFSKPEICTWSLCMFRGKSLFRETVCLMLPLLHVCPSPSSLHPLGHLSGD